MNSEPDYSQYTDAELRDARRMIDEEAYPERTAQLDRLIRDRVENPWVPPPPPTKIDFPNTSQDRRARWIPSRRTYLRVLLLPVFLLLVTNVVLLATGRLLALLPIVLQSTVLLLLLVGSNVVVVAIRLWAGMLLAGAGLYWVGVFSMFVAGLFDPKTYPIIPDKLTWPQSLFHTAVLALSSWLLIHAPLAKPREHAS